MNITTASLRTFLLVASILLLALSACTTPTVDPANRPADFDALVNDLKAAGKPVEMAETIQEPFFSVPGQTIRVNGKKVIVYQYASADARRAESDLISPDGFSVGQTKVEWVDPPHFWTTGRLIVLYVGKDQDMLDLLTQRLGEEITQGK